MKHFRANNLGYIWWFSKKSIYCYNKKVFYYKCFTCGMYPTRFPGIPILGSPGFPPKTKSWPPFVGSRFFRPTCHKQITVVVKTTVVEIKLVEVTVVQAKVEKLQLYKLKLKNYSFKNYSYINYCCRNYSCRHYSCRNYS